MKNLSLYFILFLLLNRGAFAQCTVTGFTSSDSIVCGSCATLSAYGRGQGMIIFQENFNTGVPVGWQYTQQAMFNNPCSPNGVDGTTHIWMGNSSPVPRALVTQSYNLSTGIAGVTICFDMLFATQGNSAPCEGPDEPDEGIYLQYSIDNGLNWITIHYFDPNGGNDPDLVNWNNWCFQLPSTAITSNTQIRWFQDNDSGADYDHWGIDNVQIYFNDPSYNIVMLHDSYNLGATGGVDPVPVCPRTSTDYVVQMTNGTSTCYDTIRVNVKMPVVMVDAHADTSVCRGQCVQLTSTGKVIVSPAKTARYSNDELTSIVAGLNQVTSININITTLNMTSVLPGSILGVCIHDLRYFGQVYYPTPGIVGIGSLRITLECPDGNRIVLVPSGVTSNTSLLSGYHNTCFVPVGGSDISQATAPYTGSYFPDQSLSFLDGCTANGIWKMNITMTTALGFGTGTFTGWEIIFDDPEISYDGDFSWSPTAGLSNYNTLSPTACLQNSANYYLTVADTAGCVSRTDSVSVSVLNCCTYTLAADITMPTCNESNGAINLVLNPSGGNYTFQWSNGSNAQNISGIAAGNYSVTVTDVSTSCSIDTSFLVWDENSFTMQTATMPAHCGQNDGIAAISCSGGTGNFSYSWNTSPVSTSPVLTGLSAGNYEATVTDGVCTYTISVIVADDPGPVAAFAASPVVMDDLNPVCHFSDLSTGIVNAWSWDFGDGDTSSLQSPLHIFDDVGTYEVTLIVTDTNGCRDTATLQVRVGTSINFFIPNTFTPNADDINDTFGPSIPDDELMFYEFRIFNKWGQQLFFTDEITHRWNGLKDGVESPEDVYVYRICARDSRGKEYKITGKVTLIR